MVELQREYDESKEECLGHQKVIQELKTSLEQVTTWTGIIACNKYSVLKAFIRH